MPRFLIDHYTVETLTTKSRFSRRIQLYSPVMTHGIQNRAMLFFSQSNLNILGYALNVGGLNFDGIRIIAYISNELFEHWYDILRSEAPLHLRYIYKDGETTTRFLRSVSLQSGEEVPGEGPIDAERSLEMIRQQYPELRVNAEDEN